MNKKLILLLAAALFIGGINLDLAAYAVSGPFGYDLQKDINRKKSQPKKWESDKPADSAADNKSENSDSDTVEESSIFLDKYSVNPKYYPNATMKSAIAKYKSGNYTGSLQELYTILKKDSANATAYYYLAMVYTKIGELDAAKSCYQMVINLNPNDTIVNYATKGKACLTDSAACGLETGLTDSSGEPLDELDKFIQSPFGNGFSDELNNELREKQLKKIQNKMNRGIPLNEDDLKKLNEFNKSEGIKTDKLAMAEDMPSNDEIINAVQVLKRAGLNISTQMPETSAKMPKGSATSVPAKVEPLDDESQTVQTTAQTPTVQPYTPDPQIQQMTMMLNNGNSNNSDPMMNMLPYMMQNDGKNMDPQVIQALMMNSMMNSLNGMNASSNNN
ncbi:TPA: tetratricopeptide repeat protein [Candidatus Scatousia excrementigallinarum]|uniref:Tetratricopeptide repeat protein n=1 Tax=Candidatus Scatousia excrementigallinarum TaxID=2840935 RepID=A0A9D1JMY3_9BACT|nr:tetratricopeptide repeat protein [Candidatus Scatousia excrementigallinarum]